MKTLVGFLVLMSASQAMAQDRRWERDSDRQREGRREWPSWGGQRDWGRFFEQWTPRGGADWFKGFGDWSNRSPRPSRQQDQDRGMKNPSNRPGSHQGTVERLTALVESLERRIAELERRLDRMERSRGR